MQSFTLIKLILVFFFLGKHIRVLVNVATGNDIAGALVDDIAIVVLVLWFVTYSLGVRPISELRLDRVQLFLLAILGMWSYNNLPERIAKLNPTLQGMIAERNVYRGLIEQHDQLEGLAEETIAAHVVELLGAKGLEWEVEKEHIAEEERPVTADQGQGHNEPNNQNSQPERPQAGRG